MLFRPQQQPTSRFTRVARSLLLGCSALAVSALLITIATAPFDAAQPVSVAAVPTTVDVVEGAVERATNSPATNTNASTTTSTTASTRAQVAPPAVTTPVALQQTEEDEHHSFVPALSSQGVAPPPPPPPTPTPPPAPVVTAEFRALETTLNDLFANSGYAANIAVAVTDLQTGATIAVNPWQMQLSGCVLNLYVILEALRMVEAGELEMWQVDELIYATTWSSNASTAYELYGVVGKGDTLAGVERVGELAKSLGLSVGVVADHPPSYPHVSLGIDPNNWLTPIDVNRTLSKIYHGEVLDPERTSYILDALATVKPGLNYLTASIVPADVTVSHKNGFFPANNGTFVDNDAGIVRFTRGGTEYAYAVTFLSQDNPVKYGQIPLAQQMMSEIWGYFDATYPG